MSALRYLFPLTSILLFTLVAALPWGLPTEDRFFPPFLPIVVIHFWGLRRPELVPEWFVFAAGLCLDILTHGPLGFWALVYLTAYALGVLSAPYGDSGRFARVLLFLLGLAAVAFTAWTVASIYFLEVADWRAFVRGTWLAAAAAIVIVPVLHVLGVRQHTMSNHRLARGV